MPSIRFSRALLQGSAIAGVLLAAAPTAFAQSNYYFGGSSLGAPTYGSLISSENGLNTTALGNYFSKGSGPSQCAFVTNFAAAFSPGLYPSNTAGTSPDPVVDAAASDAAVSNALIAQYYNGGQGCDTTIANVSTNVSPRATAIASASTTFTPPAAGVSDPYVGIALSNAGSGRLIQLPTFFTPITIPYNPPVAATGRGATLPVLNDAALCGLFSGKLTTLAQLVAVGATGLSTANANTINPVVRSDGSGTTFLFTTHLFGAFNSAGVYVPGVCTTANSNFPVAASQTSVGIGGVGTTTFSQIFTNNGATVPTNITQASGSGGVRDAINANTTGAFGYLSPDFTRVAPANSGVGLPAASIVNARNGVPYSPTSGNALIAAADASFTIPSGNGIYNPTQFDPNVPTPSAGYPIGGYTTFLLAQCYKDDNVAFGILGLLSDLYTNNSFRSTILSNGFVPLNTPFVNVISANILGNTGGRNLDIQNPSVCAGDGSGGETGSVVGR